MRSFCGSLLLIYITVLLCLITKSIAQGIRFDKYPHFKWSEGIDPYEIDLTTLTKSDQKTIENAIDKWNKQVGTHIRFECHQNEKDYIYITKAGDCECFSFLGKTGGKQMLLLGNESCFSSRSLYKNFMQVIGFADKNIRSDRDEYIKVLYNNIQPRYKTLYDKTSLDDYGLQGDYDFYSVLHEPVDFGSLNGKPTFQVRNKKIDDPSCIGTAKDLSPNDIKKIKQQYS